MSINVCIICGRLTKDVELSKTQNGNSVAKFTVAVNGYNNTTDFINCVAWNKLAELMSQYTHKGDMVAIEGKLNTRSYDNKYGSKTYITEVVADSVQFLSYKKSTEQQNQVPNTNTYNQPQQAEQEAYQESNHYSIDMNSDDLPF